MNNTTCYTADVTDETRAVLCSSPVCGTSDSGLVNNTGGLRKLLHLAVACASLATGAARAAPDEINVAYFLEWPTPNQVAQLEETYDKALGVKVNWKSFGSGNDMSAAMASGDIHISYSQGLIPFLVATSKGLPIKTVGIAVSYSEADNCVVHDNVGLDRSSKASIAKSLKGLKVATPIGNVTHYKLLKTLEHYGLEDKDLRIVPVTGGNDAAAAFLSDQVDIGCAFGGPVDKMKAKGKVLMSGAEQEKIGILTFDIISVTEEFARDYPGLLVKFLQVTEDANKAYAKNPGKALPTIAKAAGMKQDATKSLLGKFSFPTKKEQLSSTWMGGTVQKLSKSAADFFVSQKIISKALGSYDSVIDASYLKKVR